jgi:hypothetical protein
MNADAMVADLPPLYCPFESRINSFVEEANAHTAEWLMKYQLLPEGASIEEFLKNKYTWLTARMYPSADFENLCITSDLFAILFLLDDLFDEKCQETIFQERKAFLASHVSKLPQILLRGKDMALGINSPMVVAITELETRLRRRGAPEWQERCVQSIKDTWEVGLWEYDNMMNRRTPNVAEVIMMRPAGSGANIGTDLVEMVEDAYLPDAIYQNEIIQKLVYEARIIICWANDLFSLQKEIKSGDMCSLVFALMHEQNMRLEEAIQETARRHDEEVKQFMILEQQLPSFDRELDVKIRRYVHGLRNFVRGNVDWSILDTARYGLVDLKLEM